MKVYGEGNVLVVSDERFGLMVDYDNDVVELTVNNETLTMCVAQLDELIAVMSMHIHCEEVISVRNRW